MPKSKHRKDHKKRLHSFKVRLEEDKKLVEKRRKEFFEALQKEQLEKMQAEGKVENVVDASDVGIDLSGLDDISFDDVEIVDEPPADLFSEQTTVEGITSPDQLK